MTPEPAELDVKTALATIDRALAYTAPLQRRTEGIAWILFGLATPLFVFSYLWLMQNGYDPHSRWLLAWLTGYAFLATGPALLAWRVASVMDQAYAIDVRRVALSVVGLAVGLVVVYFGIWIVLGPASDREAIARLILALHLVLLGSAAWATLGVTQWSRMSQVGRRDTLVLAAIMTFVSLALVYAFGVDTRSIDADLVGGSTSENLSGVIFVMAFGLIPLVAGLWRLAKG